MNKEWLYLLLRNIPVNRNKIFVSSFRGLYCDNPKAIIEEVHKLDESVKIIWERSKKSTAHFPDYITVVEHGSVAQIFHQATAGVTLENGSGYYFVKWRSKFSWRFKYYKNPKSIDIATWHGTPLKHIGADIPGSPIKKESIYSSADYIIAGSEYESDIFKRSFPNTIKVLKLGNARNDKLISAEKLKQEERDKIKKNLGLPPKKIVLYCPTFRDNVEDSGLKQLDNIDVKLLLDQLKKRFGGDWCFVFRAHQKVISAVNAKGIMNKDIILDGNVFDDMVDYLIACDCVITDYSGSLFDVAITSKPCFLYAHDRQKYINEERGVYLSLTELPYEFADTFFELLNNIENYNSIKDKEKRKEFLDKVCMYNLGVASQKQALFVLDALGTRNKIKKVEWS